MRLEEGDCWERLRRSRHGVLSTVHARRGVDAVPVVYVVHDVALVLPVDTVKEKSGARLQRLRNIGGDPRVALLVEHYEDDWSALWWVRAHGRAHETTPTTAHLEALATAFPAYRSTDAVPGVILIDVETLTGWSAATDR